MLNKKIFLSLIIFFEKNYNKFGINSFYHTMIFDKINYFRIIQLKRILMNTFATNNFISRFGCYKLKSEYIPIFISCV